MNSVNRSGIFVNGSSEFFLSSLFFFWFWVFGVGLHQFPGACPSLRSDTGLADELDESCGGDVEDELLPELADNPGTTRGTKLTFLQIITFLFGVNRGF